MFSTSSVTDRSPTAVGALVWLLLVSVAGCSTSLGPRTMPTQRFEYNEAVASSWNEQLLLNLVRLRYRDPPLFLEVSSVTSQYSLEASAGLDFGIDFGGDDSAGGGAALSWRETPTVVYAPLQGEDFVRRLLKPIAAENLALLSRSGWSIARLVRCCVDRIGDLENATGAAGPTPTYEPAFAEFERLASLLRGLQTAGALKVRIIERAEGTPGGRSVVVIEIREDDGRFDAERGELARLLGLEEATGELRLLWGQGGSDEAPAVEGRSLLGVLYFLSQGVEVPQEHRSYVTEARGTTGSAVEWHRVIGGLMRIRSGSELAAGAFAAVRYRGFWFWIDDSDLESKTTFNLLSYLFALQADGGEALAPVLTVSAGG